jgi:four helix bundle protein
MATIKRFEDLELWKEARSLVKQIYQITSQGPFARDFEMRGQIRSAALSSMNNTAEGFERGSNKEFIYFLTIAMGSSAEVRSILYAALDQNYVTQELFSQGLERTLSFSRRGARLISYLRTNNALRDRTIRNAARPSPALTQPENLKT